MNRSGEAVKDLYQMNGLSICFTSNSKGSVLDIVSSTVCSTLVHQLLLKDARQHHVCYCCDYKSFGSCNNWCHDAAATYLDASSTSTLSVGDDATSPWVDKSSVSLLFRLSDDADDKNARLR